MSVLAQRALQLVGGAHAGPLFIPRLHRSLVRPKGKEGVVHRAQTVRATPRWLSDQDHAVIREMYRHARMLTLITGELQVMHWRPNAVKGPWTWPDMWNEQLELL